jgi:hypothetical protein
MFNQKIKKFKLPKQIIAFLNQPGATNIQGYKMDELLIITDSIEGRRHISISHPNRLPFPDEINIITSTLLPNVPLEIESIGRAIQLYETTAKSTKNDRI